MTKPILLLGLLAAAPALATPVDGTWKADIATAKLPTKPDMFTLKDGSYTCGSCVPAWTVKADGAFHPIAGHAYTDAVAVKVIDAHTVEEQDRLKGKPMGTSRSVISPDGAMLTYSWTDTSAPSGQVSHGTGVQSRVGKAIAGEHLMSGAWRNVKVADISDQALTGTWVQRGNSLVFSTPDGFGYTAELGGKAVTMKGAPASQTIAVKALPNGIEETSYDAGKIASVRTMTATPGGRQVKVVQQNRKQGTITSYVMNKVG